MSWLAVTGSAYLRGERARFKNAQKRALVRQGQGRALVVRAKLLPVVLAHLRPEALVARVVAVPVSRAK